MCCFTKWIQENLPSLMIEKNITNRYKLKQQGFELFPFGLKENGERVTAKDIIGTNPIESSSESDFETESSSDEDSESEEQNVSFASQTAHRGTQLLCSNLILENIGVAECYQLYLEITCERCKKHSDVCINANQPHTSLCSQCSLPYSILFRPDMLHMQSKILGYIDKESVNFYDTQPSNFKITCDCSVQFNYKSVNMTGIHNTINCMECHKLIKIVIEGIEFHRVQRKLLKTLINPETVEKKRIKKKTQQNLGLQRGQPLPHKGACKHYKKKNQNDG